MSFILFSNLFVAVFVKIFHDPITAITEMAIAADDACAYTNNTMHDTVITMAGIKRFKKSIIIVIQGLDIIFLSGKQTGIMDEKLDFSEDLKTKKRINAKSLFP